MAEMKEPNMVIDPVVLSSLAAAVSVLGTDYLKGVGSEAGKATWTALKSLFGWASDPVPAEIPEKVTNALTASPQLTEKLLALLKNGENGAAMALVGKIEVTGGKVVVAGSVHEINM
jgi:hypothetical protein